MIDLESVDQSLEDLHDLAVSAERRGGKFLIDELTSLADDTDTATAGYR